MTDKEIIIGGVNVAECEYFSREDMICEAEGVEYCVDCQACYNCYYKQLKRLEVENEKLKKEILSQNDYILQLSADSEKMEWLEDDIKDLEQENERLKEELLTYGATGICEVCTDKANKQADKYYQALAEIKEIVGDITENDIKADYCFGACKDCKGSKGCNLYPYWQILQKIAR